MAYSEEVIHIYAATDLKAGEQSLDEDEAVDVAEYPFDEVWNMAAEGKLEDAKTIAGLMMAGKQLSIR